MCLFGFLLDIYNKYNKVSPLEIKTTVLLRPCWGGGPGVSLALCCFMVCSAGRFVVCRSVCRFVLVFFSSFGVAVASLGGGGGGGGGGEGGGRAGLGAFRAFVRFVLVWVCRFPLPLGVWEGLRFVIVALPGLFFYFFCFCQSQICSFLLFSIQH